MIINTNMASLNTIRQLGINEKATQSSLAKLSSGLRINTAADDAAGLAISEKMRGQISGLNQASSNAQTAINLVSTAEGALNETTSILQRMRELAVQASSDTNTTDDRTAMQTEMNQLTSEINRIGNTTEFNTQKLLNGGTGTTAQISYTVATAGVAATAKVSGAVGNFTQVKGSVAQSATTIAATTTTASRKAEGVVVGELAQPVQDVASVKGGTGAIYGFSVDQKSVQAGGSIGTPSFDVVTPSVAHGTGVVSASTLIVGGNGAVTDTQTTPGAGGTAGVDTYQITTNFGQGQTITIAGKTFTAVASGADASKGQFNIGTGGTAAANITATRNSLLTALNDATAGVTGTYTPATSGADSFTLTSVATTPGTNAGAVVIGGAATNATYAFDVTTNFSVGDSFTIDGQTFTATAAGTGTQDGTHFQVGTTRDATAANIITALGANATTSGSYNISNIDPTWNPSGANPHLVVLTAKASGVDANANTMTPVVTQNPGTDGQYQFELKDNFVNGQTITLGGKTFTAVSSGAVAANGQFNIGTTTTGTASNLATLLNSANGLGGTYGVTTGTGIYADTVKLTELAPSGTDLKAPTVSTIAAQDGKYSFNLTHNFSVGDKIQIDTVTLTAVASGAAAGDGTFNIGGTGTDSAADLAATVTNLATAIGGDTTLKNLYTTSTGAGVAGAGTKLTLTEKAPSGIDLTTNNVKVTDTPGTQGVYDIKVDTPMTVGETVTINGVNFTAVNSATPSANQFQLGIDAKTTAQNLATAINNDATLKGIYTATTPVDGTIHLVENAGQEQGSIPTVSVTKAGEVDGVYNLAFAKGIATGDQITVAGTTFTAGDGTGGTFAVGGNIQTTLGNLITKINASGLNTQYTASLNTNNSNPLAPVYSIDLTENANQASGNDAEVTAATATKVVQATGTPGSDTFTITTNFASGEKLNIGSLTLTAGTDFTIGVDTTATATNIASALQKSGSYTSSSAGNMIQITEKTASGTNLTTPTVTANATAGVFQFQTNALAAGDSINIDGQKLTLATGGNESQTAADLQTQIQGNATLNAKYTVSVKDMNVTLTQKAGQESATAPTISFTTEAGHGYYSTLQIGANTGQTMVVKMGDMRSMALGISSTTANPNETVNVDGKQYNVAFTATRTVTNGTDNVSTEYGLDLSTADNATAAVSVIDAATSAVSSQRSNLGAYQNRLEHTINNLGTASQNITAAEAQIRDVDMAAEMTNFQKNNILQQAAQAMLAQANQQPQGVLQLLR